MNTKDIPTAAILFSHGSTLCGASETIREHAAALRRSREWFCVEVGFLNYSQPRFADTVAAVVHQGVERIVVVPYFLVAGKFVREDLRREIETVRILFPQVEFRIAEPIGYHSALVDAVFELAGIALPAEQWYDELTRAASHCEARPECPLYGKPPCKVKISSPEEASR